MPARLVPLGAGARLRASECGGDLQWAMPAQTEPKQEESALRMSTRLAPIELEDSESGEWIRLGEYWEEETAVLIFLRHFG